MVDYRRGLSTRWVELEFAPCQNYVAGKILSCEKQFENIDPADGSVVAMVAEADREMVDRNGFDGYDEVYSEFFGYDGPTRTKVAVQQLPQPHLLVEIKALAHRPANDTERGEA